MYSPEPGSVAGDSMGVDNFSRPRRPSIKHSSPDSYRYRPGYSPPLQSDSLQHEYLNHPNQYLLARERGQSIASNKSTSSFASLPVRPSPDLNYRDSVRGRSRNAHPPFSRQPMMYSRTDSSGHSFPREPLPRMASMPSDELRSSYRSQLSASTAPGTLHTERSSVLTKSSSVTSIYIPVDDGFSVDDVMGMYEKGFRDDSPADGHIEEDDESRPPTGKSELSRRKTALLEAFSDSILVQRAFSGGERELEEDSADVVPDIDVQAPVVSKAEMAAIRESTALFSSVETAALAEAIVENEDSEKPTNHDEFGMRSQQSQLQPQPAEHRYGFRKGNQYVTQEQYDSWNAGYSGYLERRRRKWQVLMKESGLITDNPIRFPPISAKTKRFVRKGIPPEWRGAAWFYYAGGPAILAKHGGVYDELLGQTAKDIDREAIERDLHRTFPDNVKFRAANTSPTPNTESQETRGSQSTAKGPPAQPGETLMISSLRRVLHAFSIYNPRIGYCQSLNFLAGLLLLFSETEEQSFWLLNIITRVYLPGTHETSLEGANVDLGVLMTSVQETMPAVWAKIGGELDGTDAVKPKSRRYRKGTIPTRLPPVTLCMTAWFMSCFIGTLPIETTLRVWDVFFYEGSKTLFRMALTIFKLGENEIKSVGDPMEIFQVVQTIPRKLLDANAMMEACFRRRNGFGHISQDTIEERRMERRRNVKLEKEQQGAYRGTLDSLSPRDNHATTPISTRVPRQVTAAGVC
ncbi:rab-GTPase-TBC domain-containing protein [Truncatella angustata]|uniref:Rab-GTPase-TBC domain-containing protein n=1 Tax=Truncatella angustata TaxID=152316 RepID=A0A9P8RLM7_9PEZI|nr:rab-GTPase-TBC domain-containing protein [Truncatella angustata]KAH6646543.1 rab-GTPase-TBC domain-containing protein [Truncatella angustata]